VEGRCGARHFRPTGRWSSSSSIPACRARRLYRARWPAGRARAHHLAPANDTYFGEGEPLFRAGIPTISLVPLPDYLCAAPPAAASRSSISR